MSVVVGPPEAGEPGAAAVSAPRPDARHTLVTAALAGGLALLVIAGGIWLRKERVEQQAIDSAIEAGRAVTAQTAESLHAALEPIEARVIALRDELELATLDPEEAFPRLIAALNEDEIATGYGIAFERDILPGRSLYAPYVERSPVRGDAPYENDLADFYDYTEFRYGWYRDTVLDGAAWIQTNIFPDTGDQSVMYATPFVLPIGGQRASGVVFAVVGFETLEDMVETNAIGSEGYTFVVSADGRYLAHPREELVHGADTLFTTAWRNGNSALSTLAVRGRRGESGFAASSDDSSGRVSWTFAEPVPATGWVTFTVFFSDAFLPDADWERHQLFIVIGLAVGGFWLLTLAGAAHWVHDIERRLWIVSSGGAAIVGTGIIMVWAVAHEYPPALPEMQQVVLDEGAAHQFLVDAGIEETRPRIPTGVLVRSLKIESGAEVAMSGYVWQRFEIGRQDNLPRGFMLPELFDPESAQIEEVFRERIDGEERIVWEFMATFRQRFDYSKFPFDRQNAWVRLRPASPVSNAVLVPDFDGYAMMNPAFRPGVDTGLVIPGWEVLTSYYDYRLHSYNATLGMAGREGTELYPELYFNVELRRLFIGPFVTYIVPLFVTAAMLFALLLISSRREASEGLLGFSAAEVVLGAAALFFVASFQHSTMREMLQADTLIYFEYFFFGLYMLMMLVSINAILFASSLEVQVIEYEDNLIPKLTFWPACAVVLFVLTLGQFY